MYIENTGGYYKDGDQHSRRANFLILMLREGDPCDCGVVRCVIRKVALRQMGHWMMGKARIGREWYTLSGSYGSDGLPLRVGDDAYALGVPLPPSLYHWWNKGGGWNSAGMEAPMMREFGKHLLRQQNRTTR